jgi:hypothetical protein
VELTSEWSVERREEIAGEVAQWQSGSLTSAGRRFESCLLQFLGADDSHRTEQVVKSIVTIFVVSILMILGRFLIPGHELTWPGAYEACAHIWVGALLVWCVQKEPGKRITSWVCLIVATELEVIMFLCR